MQMSGQFSPGRAAFIEDGIRRFMKNHNGRMPEAVMTHPEHLADVQRELENADADGCRLSQASVVLNRNCCAPVLFDRFGRQREM